MLYLYALSCDSKEQEQNLKRELNNDKLPKMILVSFVFTDPEQSSLLRNSPKLGTTRHSAVRLLYNVLAIFQNNISILFQITLDGGSF